MKNVSVIKAIAGQITQAQQYNDWKDILERDPIHRFRKDEAKYPDISQLFKPEELGLVPNMIHPAKLTTPTEKLLYAILWKNGDLLKIPHLVNGLKGKANHATSAITFYHFGKFLAHPDENPIIDQHVLRAFKVVEETDQTDEKGLQKNVRSGLLTIKNKEDCERYTSWVKRQYAESQGIDIITFFQIIDDVMFAFGRFIKSSCK